MIIFKHFDTYLPGVAGDLPRRVVDDIAMVADAGWTRVRRTGGLADWLIVKRNARIDELTYCAPNLAF
jgi:hypothetical protein